MVATRWFRFGVLTLVGAISYLAATSSAYACSCIAPDTVRDFKEAEHVFLAEVKQVAIVRAGHADSFDPGEVNGYFEVVKTYKGEPHYVTHLVAQHVPVGGMCGDTLSRQLYLVFARSDGAVGVSLCSSTTAVAQTHPYRVVLLELLSKDTQPSYLRGIYDAESGLLTLDDTSRGLHIFEGSLRLYEGRHQVEFEGYQLGQEGIVIRQVISTQPQATE